MMELEAIDRALADVGAPPGDSRAERIRGLGLFYDVFGPAIKAAHEHAHRDGAVRPDQPVSANLDT